MKRPTASVVGHTTPPSLWSSAMSVKTGSMEGEYDKLSFVYIPINATHRSYAATSHKCNFEYNTDCPPNLINF